MNGIKEECPKCAVCAQPAAQVCGGCRAEHYCGKIHQKQAWRAGHRQKCSSYRLETNETLGRHLVATRDIKQGEVIIKDKPVVLGPKMTCFPTCLSCYKRVPPCKQLDGKIDYNKCTGCGWPICDSKCQAAKVHQEECKIMTSRKYKSTIKYENAEKTESAYCVIAPLRCLLLQRSDPKQYDSVMNLESHLEERINTPIYRVLKANLVTFIQHVLGLIEFDEKTILHAAALLDTNAYDIRYKENNIKLRGLYTMAAMRSHDCNPNTKHVFSKDDYTMSIIATVPILKGSYITTSYTQPLWGTLTRRAHLQSAKCFLCTCDRCKDPTELGTYLGAIYCSRCYPNNCNKDPKDIPKVLSVDPLNNSADWKCQSCGHKLQAKQISCGNESIRKDIQLLDQENPKSFEEFILKYEQTLHPTNYHLVEIKYAMCQMYGRLPGFTFNDLNDSAVNRKISLCEEILDILNILQPGVSQARGMILLELQEAMVVKTKRDLSSTKITKEAAQELMGECMVMLQEASNILKCDPDMQDTLRKRLEDLSLELNE